MNTKRLAGRRVLLVDDDADILSSMKLAMQAEGAETATAGDGSSALLTYQATDPDAIVLDVMLPKASGFVVLEKLMQEADPPPVVMVTANQGKRHMAYAESLGVYAYLYKPVSLQRLVETVVRVIDEAEGALDGEDEAGDAGAADADE
jgi:DNA-binding response OmpR family regulator